MPPGGLERLGPPLRAMIDRGLRVEVTRVVDGAFRHVTYRSGRYRYEVTVTTSEDVGGTTTYGSGGSSFADAPEVERAIEEPDATVYVLDHDRAFVAHCVRCARVAERLGARLDRVYANGGVYASSDAWASIVHTWGGDVATTLVRCPDCGRHAEREQRWPWGRTVFVSGREEPAPR